MDTKQYNKLVEITEIAKTNGFTITPIKSNFYIGLDTYHKNWKHLNLTIRNKLISFDNLNQVEAYMRGFIDRASYEKILGDSNG